MVRIGPRDPKLVLQYLDAGMMGIMMPGLESANDVKMLIDAVKYPPLGKRGLGLTRAAGYVAIGEKGAQYVDFANEQTMVITQFEDPALINRFEEIISQPSLDAVIIGPRDLSLNMGFKDGPSHPEVQSMIERVIAICKKANVAAGITAGTRAIAEKEISRGMTMILGVAQTLILAGSKEFLPET